jgi:uncharacterized protein YndB with AHSA1/START domain
MAQDQTDLHTRTSTTADGNAVITRRVHAPTEAVWAVLADGWMYATWVVGASRIRRVDRQWPQPGSRIHHSFGVWPALIDDHTEVLACNPGRELRLNARGWPVVEARVRIYLTPASTPNSSIIRLTEDVTGGPGRLIPRPARQRLITPRNTEALRRLALIAEGHTKTGLTGLHSDQTEARRAHG